MSNTNIIIPSGSYYKYIIYEVLKAIFITCDDFFQGTFPLGQKSNNNHDIKSDEDTMISKCIYNVIHVVNSVSSDLQHVLRFSK